ncbi:glutamine synthetase family protein [Streptomyces sp. NPDC005808]|uniref:glutamine synthetase family protein n=1 Tax=Streptomyces sp. NPDC005808 TaxID=3364734 RepID=UPI0036A276E9
MSPQKPHRADQAPRRFGLLSLDDLRDAVKSGDVTAVMLAVPDMWGRLKGKRLNASVFLDRMLTGAEACAYILATDVNMTPMDGFELTGWDSGFGDLSVIPNHAAIRLLPYLPGVALIHADVAHADGELVEIAPRQMLRAQLDKLADLGLDVKVGLESEFVLLDGTPEQVLEPVADQNLDYALDHPPALTDFIQHLEYALHGAGAPPESVKTESGGRQLEVAFPYGESLAACDSYTVYRHTVRHLALRRGLMPNFMAAPKTGVGSGLHLHLSLETDGVNGFAAGQDDKKKLTETMGRAIAGLISGMPHLAPLYAPFPNSYKRYVAHSFAPTRFTWGYDNRSCAIRVTGHGAGRHLEVRLPGADANPYRALAAALAAVHHGITGDPELPPPVSGDAYKAVDSLRVPRDLVEALAAFTDSKIAQNAFGVGVVKHYAHAAQHEIDESRRRVSDVELERGFLLA